MIHVYEYGECGGKRLIGKFEPSAATAYDSLLENQRFRQTLYKTANGRWFRRDWASRPGGKDFYREVKVGQAQLWLAENGYPAERVDLWSADGEAGAKLDQAAKTQQRYAEFFPDEYLERMAATLRQRGFQVERGGK